MYALLCAGEVCELVFSRPAHPSPVSAVVQRGSSDGSTSPAEPSVMLDAKEEDDWQLLVTLNSVAPRIPVPVKSQNVRARKSP